MADGLAAIRLALGLSHRPAMVRKARRMPLPSGMSLLLRVAAGDGDAIDEALKAGSDRRGLQRAALFFVEQVLLYPGAPPQRVLACEGEVTLARARTHMALLMRCFHPDVASSVSEINRSAFAQRVIAAWELLSATATTAETPKTIGLGEANAEVLASGSHHRHDTAGTHVTTGTHDAHDIARTPHAHDPAGANIGTTRSTSPRPRRFRRLKIRRVAPPRLTWRTWLRSWLLR